MPAEEHLKLPRLFGQRYPIAACIPVLFFFVFLIAYEYSGDPSLRGSTGRPVGPSPAHKASGIPGLDINSNAKVIKQSYFAGMVDSARNAKRKRKMFDLTKDPEHNSMQTLLNAWTEGSYSPVHKYNEYAESFIVLEGALAFFTFEKDSLESAKCHIITLDKLKGLEDPTKMIVAEKGQWFAMTAAPTSMGYPGYAVTVETSGHFYNPKKGTKLLATFVKQPADGVDGDPKLYEDSLLKLCPMVK
jgi:cupin fold WbuC family metalloprotein